MALEVYGCMRWARMYLDWGSIDKDSFTNV